MIGDAGWRPSVVDGVDSGVARILAAAAKSSEDADDANHTLRRAWPWTHDRGESG